MLWWWFTYTSRNKHAIRVDGERVDNGLVSSEVLEKISVGQSPDFYVVRRPTGKTESGGTVCVCVCVCSLKNKTEPTKH